MHPVSPAPSINSAKRFKCVIKYKLSAQPLAVQWSSSVSAEVFAEQGFAVSLFFPWAEELSTRRYHLLIRQQVATAALVQRN